MRLRILALIFVTQSLLLSADASSNFEWPKPNPDNCDFYPELEKVLSCSKKGVLYLTDYAPFYCNKFMKESSSWNNEAQKWTKKTRQCLQETLYEKLRDPNLTCDTLEEVAFKTHSTCYNEADLCQLDMKQILAVIRIVKFKDYFKEMRYSDGGTFRLVNYCLKRHFF